MSGEIHHGVIGTVDIVDLQRRERRDRFAAAALTGMLSAIRIDIDAAVVASAARQLADAMIKELDKQEPPR